MKKALTQKLGLLGIVSFLSYTAAVVFAPLAYPGYNWLAQAVSDLSAANAPSLALWNQLSALYNVCEVVCVTVVCIGICIGLAASFGAFLLAGDAKGKRIALPNAEIMIHQPLIGGNGVHGPVTDIQIVSEQMQKTKQRLTHILAENTGKPFNDVAAATERDNFMSAEEALAFGLIDKIIDKR